MAAKKELLDVSICEGEGDKETYYKVYIIKTKLIKYVHWSSCVILLTPAPPPPKKKLELWKITAHLGTL